jgi:hypothetical protein
MKTLEELARELGLPKPTREEIEKELAEMYSPMTEEELQEWEIEKRSLEEAGIEVFDE